MNIEGMQANTLTHLAQFDVPNLSLFNGLVGRFRDLSARTIPSTVFLDTDGRVAARLLGRADSREMGALARAVVGEG